MKRIKLGFASLAICAMLAHATPSIAQNGTDRDTNSTTNRERNGDEDHGKWGLLGLLGLIGLAGLAKKDNTARYTTSGTGTTPGTTRRND